MLNTVFKNCKHPEIRIDNSSEHSASHGFLLESEKEDANYRLRFLNNFESLKTLIDYAQHEEKKLYLETYRIFCELLDKIVKNETGDILILPIKDKPISEQFELESAERKLYDYFSSYSTIKDLNKIISAFTAGSYEVSTFYTNDDKVLRYTKKS